MNMLENIQSPEVRTPLISLDGSIGFVNSSAAGIFVPDT